MYTQKKLVTTCTVRSRLWGFFLQCFSNIIGGGAGKQKQTVHACMPRFVLEILVKSKFKRRARQRKTNGTWAILSSMEKIKNNFSEH